MSTNYSGISRSPWREDYEATDRFDRSYELESALSHGESDSFNPADSFQSRDPRPARTYNPRYRDDHLYGHNQRPLTEPYPTFRSQDSEFFRNGVHEVQDRLYTRVESCAQLSLEAFAAITLGTLVIKLAPKARATFNAYAPAFLQTYTHQLKGTLIAAGLTASASVVSIPLQEKIPFRYQGLRETIHYAIPVLTVFLATPKVSRSISCYHVSYLGSLSYAAVAFFAMSSADEDDALRSVTSRRSYTGAIKSTASNFQQIGLGTALYGGLGLAIASCVKHVFNVEGTLVSASVATATALLARSWTLYNSVAEGNDASDNQDWKRSALLALAVLSVSCVSTLTISRFVSQRRISYLNAAFYGTVTAVATVFANSKYPFSPQRHWKNTLLHNAGPLIASSLAIGALAGCSTLIPPGLRALTKFSPVLKDMPAVALTVTLPTFFTIYTMGKIDEDGESEIDDNVLMISGLALTTLATTLLTPVVSKYILQRPMSYGQSIKAVGAGLVGSIAAIFAKANLDN